jgi:IclR family KDG regulon transcriptional repressor
LFRRTRQVVSVAMLTGAEVHHAGTLYDRDHARLALALRQPVPAHCSAAGKLLLATGAYRRTGLSYACGEYLPELVEVAAPVLLGNADPVAAMVVSGPADRMDQRAIGRILLDVVGLIEEHAESPEAALTPMVT